MKIFFDKPIINGIQVTVRFPCYRTYQNILSRCLNPNHKRFKDYGGRGITIQENWIKNFRSFYEYVISLPNYSTNNTLDRINNDLGYFEGNLRWANYQTQSENRRVPKHNTTGFKGIQIRKSTGKYKVDITANKKRIYLGDYENIEDAIEARKIYITKNNLNHN